MLLGKVLAAAAMRENKQVTWLPSYGAEVRGGTAHCMVIISDPPIGSPHIEQADTLIIMNAPSWIKFKNRIKAKGLLIVNTSLVEEGIAGPGALEFPFTDIAINLGNIKVANMAALGYYIRKKKIVSAQTVIRVITAMAPADKKSLVEINKQALLYASSSKSGEKNKPAGEKP
jgi:2-oxoglutarate ferredoxin oxidoreductase subunit gamma